MTNENEPNRRVWSPDVLGVLQHGQTDGALLVRVQFLVLQTHLQVLRYSLWKGCISFTPCHGLPLTPNPESNSDSHQTANVAEQRYHTHLTSMTDQSLAKVFTLLTIVLTLIKSTPLKSPTQGL